MYNIKTSDSLWQEWIHPCIGIGCGTQKHRRIDPETTSHCCSKKNNYLNTFEVLLMHALLMN